ncbi:hypothetical protein BH11ACT2_BH11ACT2_18850 [soil metagenome]
MVTTLHRRALAVIVTIGLAGGSLVGSTVAASADVVDLSVSMTGSASLGGSLTATLNWPNAQVSSYQWKVSPVDTGVNPVVATTQSYTPITAYKNKSLSLTVTAKDPDQSNTEQTATSDPIVITGGNAQTAQPSVAQGESFQLGGTLFLAGGQYLLTYEAAVVTTVTADASGNFAATVPVPATSPIGTRTISVQSAVPGVGKITSTTIVVTSPPDKPAMTATAPSITGSVKVDGIVGVSPGSWSKESVFRYQWQRDGSSISGATDQYFTIRPGDAHHVMRVRVTGVTAAATVTAYSSNRTVATATFSSPPRVTITGTLKKGHKLRAVTVGSWRPAPVATTYSWYVNGTRVAGSGTTITVKKSWKKKHVSVHLTATRPGYSTVIRTYTTSKKVK